MLRQFYAFDHIPASMAANNTASISPYSDYPIAEDHLDDWANVGTVVGIQTGIVVDSEGSWVTQQMSQVSSGGARGFVLPLFAVQNQNTRASYMGYRFKTTGTAAQVGASHVMSFSDGANHGGATLLSIVVGTQIPIVAGTSIYIEHMFDRVAGIIHTRFNGVPQPALDQVYTPSTILSSQWLVIGQNGGPAVPSANANVFMQYKDFYFVDDTADNNLPNSWMGPQLLKKLIQASAVGSGWVSSDSQSLLTDLLSPVTAVAGTQTAPLVSAPAAGLSTPLVIGLDSSTLTSDVINGVSLFSGLKVDFGTAGVVPSLSDSATPTPNTVSSRILVPVDSNVHLGSTSLVSARAPDGSLFSKAKIAAMSLALTPSALPNTAALLHFDGVNGATTFKEETGALITQYGTPSLSNTQAKFGPTSFFNPNSPSWIQVADSGLLHLLADFTIECFAFLTSIATNCAICEKSPQTIPATATTLANRAFLILNDGVLQIKMDTQSGSGVSLCPALTANVWHHVAAVKHGSVITGYIDGVPGSTPLTAALSWGNNPGSLVIGANLIGTGNIAGYIDEFRVSNIARYLGAFTPPTAPFTLD